MKQMLKHRNRRWGYDGWALRIKGAPCPLDWSACTTRAEARQLRKESFPELDFFDRTEVVKIRIKVEVVA